MTLEIEGIRKSVGFRKNGNEHLYSDTFGRSSVLKKEHLVTLDKVLKKAVYVKTSLMEKGDIRRSFVETELRQDEGRTVIHIFRNHIIVQTYYIE